MINAELAKETAEKFYKLIKESSCFYKREDYEENGDEVISIKTTKSGTIIRIPRRLFYSRFNRAVALGYKGLILPGVCTDTFIQELKGFGFIVGTRDKSKSTFIIWSANAQEIADFCTNKDGLIVKGVGV